MIRQTTLDSMELSKEDVPSAGLSRSVMESVSEQLTQTGMEWMVICCPCSPSELYHVGSPLGQLFLQQRSDIAQDFMQFIQDELTDTAKEIQKARITPNFSAIHTTTDSPCKQLKVHHNKGDNSITSPKQLSTFPLTFECQSCCEKFQNAAELLKHTQSNKPCSKVISAMDKSHKAAISSKGNDEESEARPAAEQSLEGTKDRPHFSHTRGEHVIDNGHKEDGTLSISNTGNISAALIEIHKTKTEKTFKISQCPKCCKTFPGKQLLRIHLQRKTSCLPIDLAARRQSQSDIVEYLDGQKNIHKATIGDLLKKRESATGYLCVICGFASKGKSNVMRHIIGRHTSDKPFQCQHCEQKFKLRETLNKHVMYKHKLGESPQLAETQKSPSDVGVVRVAFPEACPICGESSEGKELRSKHKCHSIQCEECDQKFTSASSLKQHIDSRHYSTQQYTCTKCDLMFSTRSKLTWHKKRVHGLHSFCCTVCQKSYSSEAAKKVHEAVTHGKGSKFVCEVCGLGFRWKKTFNTHRNNHLGVKKYKCSMCDKQFNVAETLRLHILAHKGEKYVCDVCGKSYTYRSSLSHHRRSHSAPQPSASSEIPPGTSEVSMAPGELRGRQEEVDSKEQDVRPFCCNMGGCGKLYASSNLLLCHLMAIHVRVVTNGVFVSFTCPFCQASLADENLVKNHLNVNAMSGSPGCSGIVYQQGTSQINMKPVAQEVIIDAGGVTTGSSVPPSYIQYSQTGFSSHNQDVLIPPDSFGSLC